MTDEKPYPWNVPPWAWVAAAALTAAMLSGGIHCEMRHEIHSSTPAESSTPAPPGGQ